ncbi:hypothetical protein N9W21_06060 [Shewanella sp.]|nr:hypothetical protein [Shewanella sp.]
MDAQQHSFCLYRSFDQRLSLVVVAAICLTSFLLWPYSDSPFYLTIKAICFILCSVFFVWQFWRLKDWSCQFLLSSDGHGKLGLRQRFVVTGKPLITPFAVLFDVQCEQDIKRLVVWRDMLDDTDYRHLCRLLLLACRDKAK